MYLKLKEVPGLFCDIDDTLVTFDLSEEDIAAGKYVIFNEGMPNQMFGKPHEEHIRTLKRFKGRGFNIVVWSQGGADWAEQVVKALKLEEFVDVICSKPDWFLDDLPAHIFMPEANRIWREDKPRVKVIKPTD